MSEDEQQDFTPDIRQHAEALLAEGLPLQAVEDALMDDDRYEQDDVQTVITEMRNKA